MIEEWLPVLGYEGLYAVSSFGRVRSVRNGHIMAGVPDSDGYPTVKLYRAGTPKRFKVHRLVCRAFHGPPALHQEVAHLDGSKSNARADNLRWCSPKENHAHKVLHGTRQAGENNGRAMMPPQQVAQIRLLATEGMSQRQIAAHLGVGKTTVQRCLAGKTRAATIPQDRQARAREGIALPRATLEKLEQFLREEGMKESSDPLRAQRIKALWEEVREAMK